MALISNSYGKGRVRIMRVHRDGMRNSVRELSVQVTLHGGFGRAYTHADNSSVVATDTIKNIVNIVAREHVGAAPEIFCAAVADRFLSRYDVIEKVVVNARETRWSRMMIGGEEHPHGFTLDANGMPTVTLDRTREGSTLRSGIDRYTFMKSTASGWMNYVMDDYTTLPETDDRIAATSMNADWLWSGVPADYTVANAAVLRAMIEIFATTYSDGMQDSVYRMANAALSAVPEIAELAIACPNKHYLPINLTPFGLSSDNLIFTPTDEPHGQIACTVSR